MSTDEEGQVQDTVDDFEEPEEWSLKAILPVAPINDSFDPDVLPETGEEYLRLVRFQSERLPAVRLPEHPVISTAKSKFEDFETNFMSILAATESSRLPKEEWINNFVETFKTGCLTDYPECSEGWPSFGDSDGWYRHLYGTPAEDGAIPPEPEDLLRSPPEQRQILQLLKFHQKWILESIDERQYRWMVRLLQCIDPRMTGRQISTLRGVAIQCISLRTKEDLDETSLFYLNGIISIIGRVFGQFDLLRS